MSPPSPSRLPAIELLVFGGFALAGLSRLATVGPSAGLAGHVAALVLLSFLGYRYAANGLLSRVWGILAFLVGWFWMPGVALAGLWLLAAITRARRRRSEIGPVPSPEPPAAAVETPVGSEATDKRGAVAGELGRRLLTMKVAAEVSGTIRAFHAPFASVYGDDGVIPLLISTEHGERGYYVETGPWDAATQEQCLQWLATLRTSDREDLEVEIRSDQDVPEILRHYTARTPAVLFELVGLLHVRVFEQPDFGRENAATLKRLTAEYLEMDFADGLPGLATLDALVVDVLRPGGQILPSTILLLGSFFGETLIALTGGHWSVQGPTTDQVTVEIESRKGTMTAHVFGKIVKLFHNGAEDSTAWMARSIAERMDGAP